MIIDTSRKKSRSIETKQQTYKRLVGFLPEAIVLISGGIVKEKGKDSRIKYRSTRINEGDSFGILWGEARVLAVIELAKYFPQSKIILTGVTFVYENLKQNVIPKNRIILESTSGNTLSQIKEVLKIIQKERLKYIVFVTNKYHLPRVRLIYKNIEYFYPTDKQIKTIVQKIDNSDVFIEFISAEQVLPHLNKKYIKIIGRVEKSSAYKKRIQSEKCGVAMIKNHKYGTRRTSDANKLERIIGRVN